MATLKSEAEVLMRARRAVIEALAENSSANSDWLDVAKSGDPNLTAAQEQAVATYVLALMTREVSDATYRMGPA